MKKTLQNICLSIASKAFKVGDMVECMDSRGFAGALKKGHIYQITGKVSEVFDGSFVEELELNNKNERSFFPTRFRKADS